MPSRVRSERRLLPLEVNMLTSYRHHPFLVKPEAGLDFPGQPSDVSHRGMVERRQQLMPEREVDAYPLLSPGTSVVPLAGDGCDLPGFAVLPPGPASGEHPRPACVYPEAILKFLNLTP